MKLKALVALIALALAGASLAYAAPKAADKNGPKPKTSTTTTQGEKPPKTGVGCKPRVAVILKGTLVALGTDDGKTYLEVKVTGGNHFAKRYKYTSAHQVDTNVYYDSSTKFNRRGHHSVDDLKVDDRLVVRAPVCKQDLTNTEPPVLTAKRVTAQPKKS